MDTIIPARHSAHARLARDETIQIINPSGNQVVDLWAFPMCSSSTPSWLSTAQSRQKLQRITLAIGDTLVDTRRKPLLTLVEDTSPGVHDMLYPACDDRRYAEAGVHGHASCAENLNTALGYIMADIKQHQYERGAQENWNSLEELEKAIRTWGWTPEPLNLFMNVSLGKPGERGNIRVARPLCKAGDYVVLRAEVGCVVVMSACPNDLQDTNGGVTGEAAYRVFKGRDEINGHG